MYNMGDLKALDADGLHVFYKRFCHIIREDLIHEVLAN